MAYSKYYTRINWKNRPSTSTPLGATNLNHVDQAVDELDNRIVTLDAGKYNVSDAQNLCNGIDYDTSTGVFVFHYVNGGTKRVDLNIEKIPVSMSLSADGILTITNTDGTKYTSNIASLLVTINFVDSTEIDFQVSDAGKVRTVTAVIKNGSITTDKLDPDIQANILNNRLLAETAATNAQTHARDSKRYAVGGVISADVEDNAKHYCEKAGEHEAAAALSEGKAKTSETNAKASETAAQASKTSAAASAESASASSTSAALSAANAKESETVALNSADAATASEAAAGQSATNAEASNQSAAVHARNAGTSATASQTAAQEAQGWAEKAEQVVDIHIATPDRPGIVMPDNVTFKVGEDGTASVPTATGSTKGIVKGGAGIKVAADGAVDVNTQFTQATALANIIAGEAIAVVLGKVSKAIATTMNLDSNALLKSMLTSQDVNDANKIPTASLLYSIRQNLQSQISGKIDTSKIVNNLLSTDASTVLSGAMGKNLADKDANLQSQITQLNSEMSYFKAYKFTDSDVLDNDIKTAIGWYINNAIDKKRHSFIITLELTKGSTFSIFGMTASTPSYCAAQVFSYALPVPLYGIRNNGTWTWK